MARNEQLIRQHKLLQILERRRYGATLNELRDSIVEELGLSSLHTRSIRRDIEALQIAGIDIQTDERPDGRIWKLGDKARNGYEISFTSAELMAMALAKDLLGPFSGTVIGQGVSGFWSKVEECVPPATYEHFEQYRRAFIVSGLPPKSYERQHGIIKTLQRGILEHRFLGITYGGPTKEVEVRRIAPLGIILNSGSLYVVAFEQVDDDPVEFRHWKLDRIVTAEVTDSYFTAPEEFDLNRYQERGIGVFARGNEKTYTVRLSKRAAVWVSEDPWHIEQTVSEESNGVYILEVSAAHDLEIIPRVLALGEDAEILTPKTTREIIQGLVAKLHDRYSKTSIEA